MTDAFAAREKALENKFFRTVDQALVERMQDELVAEDARKELIAATGITNNRLLDELLEIGIGSTTLVAFSLLPLALVAWADGVVDEEEREVVLNTASALGCTTGTAAWQLLESWLTTVPPEELFDVWLDTAPRIETKLTQVSRGDLIRTIVGRAKSVAEATGGVLGLHRVSSSERAIILKIEAAFSQSYGKHS